MGENGVMRFPNVCLLIALGLQATAITTTGATTTIEATTITTTGTTTTIEATSGTTLITTTDTEATSSTTLITTTDTKVFCCHAFTAQCESCKSGTSVEIYCRENPDTPGCSKAPSNPTEFSPAHSNSSVSTSPEGTVSEAATTTLPPGFVYSTHCDVGQVSPLAINDPVLFCIFLSTTPPKKMVFKLVVEEYASLVLHGSKDLALGAAIGPNGEMIRTNVSDGVTDDIHTWIARSDAGYAHALDCGGSNETTDRAAHVSCPQIYASASHIAHVLSLVVNLQEGSISSFVWDNGCSACGPQRCMRSARSLGRNMIPGSEKFETGSCGRTYVQCEGNSNACDLQILVTWAGTDRKGNHLHSAGRRLSKFGSGSIGSMYETMDYQLR